jgi:hypothetical protein
LRDIALHAGHSRIECFMLSIDTMYDEYLHAITSYFVPVERLVPPEYPNIRIRCRVGFSGRRHFHRDY